MTFPRLIELVGDQAIFDLPTLRILSGEKPGTLSMNLSRWRTQEKIIQLRRGLYSLSDAYRKEPLHGPLVANRLYHPSYLSEVWALSWFGIIPDKVEMFTSTSTRTTRTFRNMFGDFRYRQLKVELFFGFRSAVVLGAPILLADPEKALLDLFYLETGDWTPQRMEGMRIDPYLVNIDRLWDYAGRFDLPRMSRAVGAFGEYAGEIEKGGSLL